MRTAVVHSLGQFTPVFVEKATGDQLAPQLEKDHGGVDPDPRLAEYVGFVGKRLVPFSPRAREIPHTFKVLKSEKIVNAFALGNGNVYVTRAILALMDDESELAEILGHEVGHVAHRHIGKRIDQAVGLSVLLATAQAVYAARKGGELSARDQGLVDAANEVVPAVVLNGFGREQELESDASGLGYMVKAGYDPLGSVRVFQRFQKLEPEVSGLAVFFRSHPTAKTRVGLLEESVRKKYPGVEGERFRDRYQAIVKGGRSLSDVGEGRVLGMKPVVAVAAGSALALGVVLLVLSV
ncbi:MAG: M48 family metalloprotease [Vicinamibacteria bacterium]